MPGSHHGRRQQRVIVLGLTVGALAGQAARTAPLLRAEIFAAIQCDQYPATEPHKVPHTAVLPHLVQSLLKTRLQQFRRHLIQQVANGIIAEFARSRTASYSSRRCAPAPCAADATETTRFA